MAATTIAITKQIIIIIYSDQNINQHAYYLNFSHLNLEALVYSKPKELAEVLFANFIAKDAFIAQRTANLLAKLVSHR